MKLSAAGCLVLAAGSTILNSSDLQAQSAAEQTMLVYPTFKHAPIRKAGKYHLWIFVGPWVDVDDPQGVAAVKLDSRDDPNTRKDDDEISVYGVNSGGNQIIYNTSMTSVSVYGNNEPDEQKLLHPHGIAADRTGRVLVADTGNNRIVELKDSGELEFIRAFGKMGAGPGEFNAPRDVALDSKGNIYVADTGNNRIQVISDSGVVVGIWGGGAAETFYKPKSIAVVEKKQGYSRYNSSFAVIADRDGKELKWATLDGEVYAAVTGSDFGNEGATFGYLAIDYYSNLYATDQINHCIYKFDRHHNYLDTFGKYGDGKNEFIEPRGIAIARRFGQVIIAEKETAQYYWIGTEIKDVGFSPVKDGLSVNVKITELSYLTVDIFDKENNFIKRLGGKRKRYQPGTARLKWDLRPGKRREKTASEEGYSLGDGYTADSPVSPGVYRMKISARATYSSRKHFLDEKELKINLGTDGNIRITSNIPD